jgi:hypothetical protein
MSLAMRKNTFKKKTGLNWVLSSRLGHGSTRQVNRVFAHPGLLSYLDRFNHWVDRIPDRPTGPVQV